MGNGLTAAAGVERRTRQKTASKIHWNLSFPLETNTFHQKRSTQTHTISVIDELKVRKTFSGRKT